MIKVYVPSHNDIAELSAGKGGYLVLLSDYETLENIAYGMLEDMQGEGMHTADIEKRLKEFNE